MFKSILSKLLQASPIPIILVTLFTSIYSWNNSFHYDEGQVFVGVVLAILSYVIGVYMELKAEKN